MLASALLRFFPPPRALALPAAGLDISDRTVKFVELGRVSAGLVPLRFGVRPLPAGIVEAGEVKNPARLGRELAALVREFGLSFVRFSLPEEKAFIFETRVPANVPGVEVRSAIEFGLEENVPLSPAEAIFDYELGPAAEDGSRPATVAVYPKATVANYLAALRAAGLTALSCEIEAHAVVRAVIRTGDAGTYLVADIGRRRTGIAIASRGTVAFSATLEVGGDDLTRAIEKHHGVSEADAERLKNERGFLKERNERELFASLMTTVSALRDEMNRHIAYWHGRKGPDGKPVPRLEKILLCGGNANLAGLPEYLASSLSIPVERANVWANTFSFDDVIPDIDFPHSLSYATAVGLALANPF